MSKRMILATIGGGMVAIAGIIRLTLMDWPVGMLLIGLALAMWDNARLRQSRAHSTA